MDTPNDTRQDAQAMRSYARRIRTGIIITCCFLVLAFSGIFTLSYLQSSRAVMDRAQDILLGLPIAELAVYDFTFEVFVRASEDQTGNFAVKILSVGMLDPDRRIELLYKCGVELRYGVDLGTLAGRYRVTADNILIELPPPALIDRPRLLNMGEFASGLIDIRHDGLIKKPDTTPLEGYVRARCQEEAAAWPGEFGLDGLVRERVRHVISQALAGYTRGRAITIRFDDEGGPQ